MSTTLRFGAYEFNAGGMELRKQGRRVRLQQQPGRVLMALIARPGEVVTREELKNQIWPADTFVDFEHSLNSAVNRLRAVLHDDAAQPRYVETVPRIGYRFISPVLVERGDPQAPVLPPPCPAPSAAAQVSAVRWKTWEWKIAVAVVIAMSLFLLKQRFRNKPTAATGSTELLVSDAWDPRLSPDGQLLAYISSTSGDVPHVWLRQLHGGRSIQLTSGTGRDSSPEFSADGTSIIFTSEGHEGGVFVVATSGGRRKLLVPGASWARLSPDGRRLLYAAPPRAVAASTTPAIFISTLTDGKAEPITELPGTFVFTTIPEWSPSGKAFWFFGHRSDESRAPDRWWLVRLTERAVMPLSLTGIQPNCISWCTWGKSRDGRSWMLYSVLSGTTWKLFRIQVADTGKPEGKAEQVTSSSSMIAGTGLLGLLGRDVSISENGTVAFALCRYSGSLFQFQVDEHGRRLGPATQLPLAEGPLYYSPSLSRDGAWLSYSIGNSGKPNTVLLRNLLAGTERVLREEPGLPGDTPSSISPDGSRVVYRASCNPVFFTRCPSLLVEPGSARPQILCDFCTGRGFSSDGSTVLVQSYAHSGEGMDKILAIDLKTKRKRDFLTDSKASLYHPYMSWDDRWVVFKRLLATSKAQILIAPVRAGAAAPQSEWLTISDGKQSDDKPQFSAAGDSVLFTSDRDGYLCIWRQQLDSATKHPLGDATAFEHFHNSMGRDGVAYPTLQWMSDLSVAKDKLVIALPQVRSEIWRAN